MKIQVNVDEYKMYKLHLTKKQVEKFVQHIVDKYCNENYFNREAVDKIRGLK